MLLVTSKSSLQFPPLFTMFQHHVDVLLLKLPLLRPPRYENSVGNSEKSHPSHGPPSIEVNNSNGNHADSRSIEIYVSLLQKNLQVSCDFLNWYFKGRTQQEETWKYKKTQKLIIEQRKTARKYFQKKHPSWNLAFSKPKFREVWYLSKNQPLICEQTEKALEGDFMCCFS